MCLQDSFLFFFWNIYILYLIHVATGAGQNSDRTGNISPDYTRKTEANRFHCSYVDSYSITHQQIFIEYPLLVLPTTNTFIEHVLSARYYAIAFYVF